MENLTVSKDNVLKAAASCPQAKTILITLFPEVFGEDDKYAMKKLSNDERCQCDELLVKLQEITGIRIEILYGRAKTMQETCRGFWLCSYSPNIIWKLEDNNILIPYKVDK